MSWRERGPLAARTARKECAEPFDEVPVTRGGAPIQVHGMLDLGKMEIQLRLWPCQLHQAKKGAEEELPSDRKTISESTTALIAEHQCFLRKMMVKYTRIYHVHIKIDFGK